MHQLFNEKQSKMDGKKLSRSSFAEIVSNQVITKPSASDLESDLVLAQVQSNGSADDSFRLEASDRQSMMCSE